MAQPSWFDHRPEMAWAFYGHRQQLYRATTPHDGFRMLLEWGRAMPAGYFVVTSNVDGQFGAAGFPGDRVLEQHGSIHRYQCTTPCGDATWQADPPDLQIDLETITARGVLPRCPQCGALARPNVLMFADADWVPNVTHEQERRYRSWLASVRGRKLVILELGAGTAIATIRWHGESLATGRLQTTLVRVNPDATEAEEPVIPVRLGALEALTRIEAALTRPDLR
jgi:NAD-dependent SIR2 family protein deacetylase